MANADITFHKAQALTWVQSFEDTVTFTWEGVRLSFQRAQLDELLGALHIVTGTTDEVTLTTKYGHNGLVQFIDGEFFPLGVNA
jgi:hypothetical protein